nr:hypothetical protein [Tanacetum cinerariifolium]
MPLLKEKRSHCQEDHTAINVKKKMPVKDGSYAKLVPHVPPCLIRITEIVTSYTTDTTTTTTTSGETGTKSGRTVTLTAKDMQKKKNDVKARTTLLLSLPDEHQLRFNSGPIESRVKHLLGSVVWAMISLSRSIVASLENDNGFLAVYTPSDDLIRTDFEQKGVVPEVMLHIFKEFVFLLGRHSLNNEIPRMEENPTEQSRLGIFLSKEIFEGGMIRIHNAFVHDEECTCGKVACIAHKLKGQIPIGGNQD